MPIAPFEQVLVCLSLTVTHAYIDCNICMLNIANGTLSLTQAINDNQTIFTFYADVVRIAADAAIRTRVIAPT